MRILLVLILLLCSNTLIGQTRYEVTPEKYWITDSNFDEKINGTSIFGDDEHTVVVVEFWAKFNEINCFKEWRQLKNVKYYRINIADAPIAKKKYRVRIAPTLIIFQEGSKFKMFKAGLDLVLKEDLKTIQRSIDEANIVSQF